MPGGDDVAEPFRLAAVRLAAFLGLDPIAQPGDDLAPSGRVGQLASGLEALRGSLELGVPAGHGRFGQRQSFSGLGESAPIAPPCWAAARMAARPPSRDRARRQPRRRRGALQLNGQPASGRLLSQLTHAEHDAEPKVSRHRQSLPGAVQVRSSPSGTVGGQARQQPTAVSTIHVSLNFGGGTPRPSRSADGRVDRQAGPRGVSATR